MVQFIVSCSIVLTIAVFCVFVCCSQLLLYSNLLQVKTNCPDKSKGTGFKFFSLVLKFTFLIIKYEKFHNAGMQLIFFFSCLFDVVLAAVNANLNLSLKGNYV